MFCPPKVGTENSAAELTTSDSSFLSYCLDEGGQPMHILLPSWSSAHWVICASDKRQIDSLRVACIANQVFNVQTIFRCLLFPASSMPDWLAIPPDQTAKPYDLSSRLMRLLEISASTWVCSYNPLFPNYPVGWTDTLDCHVRTRFHWAVEQQLKFQSFYLSHLQEGISFSYCNANCG